MRRGERMKTIFLSDQGKVRPHNEDSVGIFKNRSGTILAIVADGMGGHKAGDIASSMTITHFETVWAQTNLFSVPEDAEKWLKEQITIINTILYEHSLSNQDCQGMGTTIVVSISTENFTTIAHIGDSRGYILNNNGFQQITVDHSYVNELVRSGQISKLEAENHPRKNVLMRALGTEKTVEIDIKTIILEKHDILMLCSDGLSNKVQESELSEILREDLPLEKRAEKLVLLANDRGGEDNITLAIVEYMDEESR